MNVIKVFFTALVCCYDSFCQCCCPQHYENKNRIEIVSQALGCDADEANKTITRFDSRVKSGIERIDTKNPYVRYKNYIKYLKDNHPGNIATIVEDEKPNIDDETKGFIKKTENIKINLVKRNRKSFYHENLKRLGQSNLSLFENTFKAIKESFLAQLERENAIFFQWNPNRIVNAAGGPERQLLSTFYENLLEKENAKLLKKEANDDIYIVFSYGMQYNDVLILGKLAFLSWLNKAYMEYNLPEVYYKIMLHDKNEKLEDYLTLADFKTMIGIMKETKDGNTVDGNLLIPVDIKINPDKDRVFLKYAKEEAYKIYLKLCQEDNWKDFKAFEDNFEEEIAELMFEGLGIKIKEVLGGFMDGFQSYFNTMFEYLDDNSILNGLLDYNLTLGNNEDINTTTQDTGNSLFFLKRFFQASKFRPKDFKVFIEGETVVSVKDLIKHFDTTNSEPRFTINDIENIVNQKIKDYDELSKKKFFERLSFLLIGSNRFSGTVRIELEHVDVGVRVCSCYKKLTLSPNRPKETFKVLLDLVTDQKYDSFDVA